MKGRIVMWLDRISVMKCWGEPYLVNNENFQEVRGSGKSPWNWKYECIMPMYKGKGIKNE